MIQDLLATKLKIILLKIPLYPQIKTTFQKLTKDRIEGKQGYFLTSFSIVVVRCLIVCNFIVKEK